MGNQWQYTALMQLSKLVCRLSYERILRIGRRLGPLVLNRLAKPRERAANKMMTSFGMTRAEVEPLLQEHFENLGMSALEMLYTPRLVADKENLSQYIEIDHPERMWDALAKGAGVIALTAHIGNWEWLGAGLALYGFPLATIAKRQPNDQVTAMLDHFRTLVGMEVFYTGGAELIGAARAMKKKKILGFLADKDGGKGGVPVMFLNRISSAVEGPAVFARRFNAPVVPVFITRRRVNGKVVPGHKIHLLESFYYEDTGDSRADIDAAMRKMTKVIEDFIYEHPSEWLWIQRRWWTAPEEMERLAEMKEELHGDIT